MPATPLKSPRALQHAAAPHKTAPSLTPNEVQDPTITQALRELERRQRRIDGLERALEAKQRRIEALEKAQQRRHTTLIGKVGIVRALFGAVLFVGSAYLIGGSTAAAWVGALLFLAAMPVPDLR